jgi:hypothetical protein
MPSVKTALNKNDIVENNHTRRQTLFSTSKVHCRIISNIKKQLHMLAKQWQIAKKQ